MDYVQIIRIDMKLANEDVSMLAFTSEQITAPFLLPEMVTSFHSALMLVISQIYAAKFYLLKFTLPSPF